MQEKKHPLLAFLMPPAVRGATLRVVEVWGCRLRRRAGLLLAQAFATLRVAEFIALRRDRGRGVTFLLVQESNQRSTPKGATLTRRSPLWNPLLAACAIRNSTAALVALYNSRGSA